MTILVTGGAGYIGSHCCVELLQAGYRLAVVDNLVNSSPLALERVRAIVGPAAALSFHRVDLCDAAALERVFAAERPQAVIHFAGLKAVGESVQIPLRYYENNLIGTLNLLAAMRRHGCRQLVFSSSATVYGDPERVPIREDAPRRATNPYGRTKLIIEYMLEDLARAEDGWSLIALRYFNPVGAHPSGLIGEDPQGIPNNLMPYALQVAVGRLPCLQVFGNDWPTPDGTGVRDYIHVVDLARGHLAALAKLPEVRGFLAINLGTGRGHSVLEVVQALSRAVGRAIPYRIVGRRPGDIAACWADPSFAAEFLGWRATLTLDDMCRDGWHWQSRNPDGYRSASA
ncbi:MAG: UDP-glucose 4-epimerase GalE [Planctomycetota bacterium]|nr:UDP-glucose 4-epimerase GalE [Planctomycetota bacterium]MCX8039231.1 UDP-glucose 4-epimerase GalE [Planctomycetota bacterium]MDW8372660.1 UDP-glucose 4-epimerase GalE [Planctomycetota bacterium]